MEVPGSRIGAAIVIGVVLGCVFAFFYPYGFFTPYLPTQSHPLLKDDVLVSHSAIISMLQVESQSYESTEWINMLRSHIKRLSEKNVKLQKQVKKLNEKLQIAEQEKSPAQEQLVLLGEPKNVPPFGKAKSTRTNHLVLPDESLNPRLAKILAEVAVEKEVIVVLANSNVKSLLEIWFTSVKRVGIPNYLVVALDDDVVDFCNENGVHVYLRDPDETVDLIGKSGGNYTVPGLKFRILREFLQLGYSVLLSDVNTVYLQNPFDHLYRDSDVEVMSDGLKKMTIYVYNDISDEPDIGWGRYTHTKRIWACSSAFFYIRPTIPAIELLDRVAERLTREPNTWDQAVFNEELAFPSYPGYIGLYASRRVMNFYLFMNNKVLIKIVRKDENLKKLKPVVVHIDYHPDKLYRMKAVVEYYVNGKQDALDSFPDGSEF